MKSRFLVLTVRQLRLGGRTAFPKCFGQAASYSALHTQASEQPPWWLQQSCSRITAAMVVALGFAATVGTAYAGAERLNPDTLRDLARDLRSGTASSKERAVSVLANLTIYVEHHDALLDAGIFPALMHTVTNQDAITQVRSLALGCIADLMKEGKAREAAAATPDFLSTVVQAMQSEDRWGEGPEEGGSARASAARIVAELSETPEYHAALVASGAVTALLDRAAAMAKESAELNTTFASLSAVPGTLIEHTTRDEERYAASALFGLAGTPNGAGELLQRGERTVAGLCKWAGSNDPVLQRYGVGALARLAIAGLQELDLVAKAGGVAALVSALTCADPQAQCFASGALGRVAQDTKVNAEMVARAGTAQRLVMMLQPVQQGVDDKQVSPAVRDRVVVCALNAMSKVAEQQPTATALRTAGAVQILQAMSGDESRASQTVKRLAAEVLRKLS